MFNEAVAQAAELATQRVAAVHRVRLVTQAFLAALVVSVSVAIILAFVFKGELQTQAKHAAVANCRLIQAMEKPLSDFVRSDAQLRIQQAKVAPEVQRALARVLGQHVLTRAEARSARIGTETTGYWLTSVAPRLDAIATVECSRR